MPFGKYNDMPEEARDSRTLLGAPLGAFYDSLSAAEARHAALYVRLAEKRGDGIATRLAELATIEAELATSTDVEFRFHSGTPV